MRRTSRAGFVLVALAAPLLVASHAGAAPPTGSADATSYFIAGNPHVPLAIVSHGVVRDAVDPALHGKSCGARHRWARPGSRWRALDQWGQVVGTYAMGREREVYDATGCIEESFVGAPANDSILFFVSVDSPWLPSASAEWKPTREESASLLALADDLSKGQPHEEVPHVLTEITTATRYFEVPTATGATTRMAVAGRCGGWLVAARVRGSWSIVTRQLQAETDHRECFRPAAVFDMSGDGVPEIIMRFTEYTGEFWGERVLQRSSAGTWISMALSPGGSTA